MRWGLRSNEVLLKLVLDKRDIGKEEKGIDTGNHDVGLHGVIWVTLGVAVVWCQISTDIDQLGDVGKGNLEEKYEEGKAHAGGNPNVHISAKAANQSHHEDGKVLLGGVPELNGPLILKDFDHSCHDDSREGRLGDVVEEGGEEQQGAEDDEPGNDGTELSLASRVILDGSPGEAASGGIGTKERANQVGEAKGEELLAVVE